MVVDVFSVTVFWIELISRLIFKHNSIISLTLVTYILKYCADYGQNTHAHSKHSQMVPGALS